MAKPQTRQQARQQARHQAKQQARQHPKVAAAATPSARARTRQEKKDRARLQREAIRKQMARRRRARVWTMVGVALAAVAAIVILVVVNNKGSASAGPVNPRALPGMQTGPPPWTNNTQDLDARISTLGLPPLSPTESVVFHIHQHIDIVVDGQPVTVPLQVGITAAGEFAVIHTHDTSGVIHVESPVQKDYTLGEFFDVWGVLFTKNCIGGLCTNGTKTLTVYVNGTKLTTDPTKLVLQAHQEIVVAYGNTADLPKPIPKSYSFPAGE
jgi:hypothetical protein